MTRHIDPQADEIIEVNRAPVLTLWAAVVAERLGHHRDAALTLGKAVAGLNAQTKGRRLGIYGPPTEAPGDRPKARMPGESRIQLLGRPVPVQETKQGLMAVVGDKLISPQSVSGYLQRSFGEHLPAVRSAMEALANSYDPDELEQGAYGLYEQFRPAIPGGKRGWGAKGKLDLRQIRAMANRK